MPPEHLSKKDLREHPVWIHALTAHSLIHAGAVWIVLGIPAFAFAEFVLHWVIDFFKGRGCFGFNADQLLHYSCKATYVAILFFWTASA